MSSPSAALPAVLDRIDAELDNSVGRLFDFLKIQSVSTDPAYKDQCRSAAEYVRKDLAGIGLEASLRPTDIAARLGGDEFGVLLFDVPDVAYARTISERLLTAVQAPLLLSGREVEVGASIGIAMDTESMRTVDDLMSDADVAMYQAKAQGKGRHQVYAGAADRSDVPERAWSEPRHHVRKPTVGPAPFGSGAS